MHGSGSRELGNEVMRLQARNSEDVQDHDDRRDPCGIESRYAESTRIVTA